MRQLTLGENDVLVIEGIHCLNDEFSNALPKESKYRIYISCLTTLNVDDHNRIPTTDARLLRRIERDARTRGYGARATIKMWPSVRRGEEENIFPYQDSADTVFNSALIYETALLKPYVEPLLFGVPQDCDGISGSQAALEIPGLLPASRRQMTSPDLADAGICRRRHLQDVISICRQLHPIPGGHTLCPPGFSAGNPDFFKFPLDNGNAPPYNPTNLLDWLYLFTQKRGFP